MACKEYFGVPVNSLPLSWSSGAANQQIKLDFINNIGEGMAVPMVDEAYLRTQCDITVAGGETARGDLLWQIISQIDLRDVHGELWVLDTTSARVLCQMLLGERFYDPIDMTAGANQTFDLWMPVPVFGPTGAIVDAHKCAIPAYDLAKGKLQLAFCSTVLGPGAANRFTVNSATVEFWVTLRDDGATNTTNMRLVGRDQNIGLAEDEYPMPGERPIALSWFFGAGNENANGGFNAWPAQLITSRNFGWSQVPNTYFGAQYSYRRRGVRTIDPAGAAAVEDEVLRGLNVPLFSSREDQSAVTQPQIDTNLHIKTNLVVGAGNFTVANLPKLIRCSLVPNPLVTQDSCQLRHGGRRYTLGPVIDTHRRKVTGPVNPNLLAMLPREVVTEEKPATFTARTK